MKVPFLILNVFILTLLTFSCTKTEQEKYRDITQINTIQVYQDFIKENTKSIYADSAKIAIQKIHLEEANTVDALNLFLEAYPESVFLSIVHQRIEQLKLEEAKTIKSLKYFLKSYPKSIFVKQANHKIDSIRQVEKKRIHKIITEKRNNPWYVAAECIANSFIDLMNWRISSTRKINMIEDIASTLKTELTPRGEVINHAIAKNLCGLYKTNFKELKKMGATPSELLKIWRSNPENNLIYEMVNKAYKKAK